jgi:serine/threonine-protein kinase
VGPRGTLRPPRPDDGPASIGPAATKALQPPPSVTFTRHGAFVPFAPAPPAAAAAPPSQRLRAIQSQRGTYLVGAERGAGHFGSVHECFGPFDQRYALKVLRPSGRPIEQVRAEWAKEVQRLLALRHPNVVYIHDAFEWAGHFCVALEWCDHSLREMLEQPLREELALELSRQMLAAVQYLHDNDLVHDDLHPGNVLIQQADRPIVKISDFGISHELRGAHAVRPELVHHAIMAPELLAAGYTSKQSDLYQLGLVMYWMIAGAPPHDLNVPYEQLARQIAEGVARQRAEAFGTPFGSIVAKMLRRRDAYRYGSAREVWEDLRQLPAWRTRQLFHPR